MSVHTDDSDDSDEEEGEDTLIGAGGRVFHITTDERAEIDDRDPSYYVHEDAREVWP